MGTRSRPYNLTHMRNYFGAGVDARRYARARPRIHAAAIEKFCLFARVDRPLSRAVDVGCGTGQSTVALALANIAETIVGIDPSADMLALAVHDPRVEYRQGSAEHVPLPDESVDLVTAGLAFHWFDPVAFLAEARRLLRPGGWLVVYNSWCAGEMLDVDAFSIWFRQDFFRRFPTPWRNSTHLTHDLAQPFGLRLRGEDTFSNEIEMSAERFVDYELSTTSVMAAIDRGDTTLDETASWMRESLRPFFEPGLDRTFRFDGRIVYVEKSEL